MPSTSPLLSLWFYYTHAYTQQRQPHQNLHAWMDESGLIRSDPIWSKIYMTCKIHPIYIYIHTHTHNVGNFENFGAISRFLKRKPFYAKCASSLRNFLLFYMNTSPTLTFSVLCPSHTHTHTLTRTVLQEKHEPTDMHANTQMQAHTSTLCVQVCLPYKSLRFILAPLMLLLFKWG